MLFTLQEIWVGIRGVVEVIEGIGCGHGVNLHPDYIVERSMYERQVIYCRLRAVLNQASSSANRSALHVKAAFSPSALRR